MKTRKIKKRIYRNRATLRKMFSMKFIEVNRNLYPLNDRVTFKEKIDPNGTHWVVLNYMNESPTDIKIGDATNCKDLPFEKLVEKVLSGKIKEVKL